MPEGKPKTRRILVESPSGERFEAEVPCEISLRKVGADFFESQKWWSTLDRRGRGFRAVVELVNPGNPDETKRLDSDLDICEAGVRDGDTLRIFPESIAGGDYRDIDDIGQRSPIFTNTMGIKLSIFLSYASEDRLAVIQLYHRLKGDGWYPWIDEEDLMPGQEWEKAIPQAVHSSHVVLVCLSNKAITKTGFFQQEIRFALDAWKQRPEETIFLIPGRLEDCKVPASLAAHQWVDLFKEHGYRRLIESLQLRASQPDLQP